jgi:hypothetical protein
MSLVAKEDEALAAGFTKDPRWHLVERILASPHFVKSGRLSSFLTYVCRRALTGRGATLNEQTIGEEVFERPVGYDPREDNIVRAHASRLRVRLESYFQEEGASEPLRLIIPRGAYVPVFQRAEAEEPPFHEPLTDGAPGLGSTSLENAETRKAAPFRWKLATAIGCFLLACVLMAAGVISYRRDRAASSAANLPSHKLWSQLFRSDQETLIVPADSSLVIAKEMLGHRIDLADYASGRYHVQSQCLHPCDRDLLQMIEGRRYTSIADLEFVFALSHLPEALPDRTRIRYVRDLQMQDLKQSNLILAGSLEADPWLSLMEPQMNFILHDDAAAGPLRIENKNPKQGEPRQYLYDDDDPQHRGFATIAFLPNQSGNGSMLIVQGFTLAGTEAAAEFLTNGSDFNALFHSFANTKAKLPFFEIVLQTMDVNGVAFHPTVLAWRTYP